MTNAIEIINPSFIEVEALKGSNIIDTSRDCLTLAKIINPIYVKLRWNDKIIDIKLIKCPYCDKEGSGPNMTRYHFNKCKSKI